MIAPREDSVYLSFKSIQLYNTVGFFGFRSEMDSHLDSVQSDLESLKELLQCEGISLDANALLGVSIL